MFYLQRVISASDVKSANVFVAQAWTNIINSSTLWSMEYSGKSGKQIQLNIVTHCSPICGQINIYKTKLINVMPGDDLVAQGAINSHFIEYVGYMSPHLLEAWILIKCIRLIRMNHKIC